ncbi:MAG: glutamine-synthetase adenylyltransferase [Roseobacter sp.]
MKLSQNIARIPRQFDKQKGIETSALMGDVPREISDLVAGAAGCSSYLAKLVETDPEWLVEAVEDVDAAINAEVLAAAQDCSAGQADRLRKGKRRIALLTALCDLGGAWPLERVTQALSDFADAACQGALKTALLHQIKRGKLPGISDADVEEGAGMIVLAMGKMGAGELNYSSDIDLICLFDETRFDGDTYHEARAGFARATRAMAATLSEITAHGYVFRTDLRLRPDPSVTPVCIAMEAAEHYYESLGRTWERAAYIKARVAAGDQAAGARFLQALTPFVWRRHLDFAAIQDAHDMRLAIREHKGLGGPITLPGHNMKLGRGGIREIEFFTQTRQLIAGGRDIDLRCRGTVQGLRVLTQKGWVTKDVAQALERHYVAHRTVEHRLQMVQDAQTHSLPRSDEGFSRIAAMMDMDSDALKIDLRRRLEEVHELTEGFFAPGKVDTALTGAELDKEILNKWVSYPALRSARSRQVFERVKPELLSRLSQAARPHEALLAFDGFLSGLPAGVQLFSLLEANPQLTDLIIDITGTSAGLAQYLSRNAEVFDAVIGGDFFTDWPGQQGLHDALCVILANEKDYETQLDATRRWFKEWHFRIGVHLLRGLISPLDARAQYSDLARAVLDAVWPAVQSEFGSKYGPPPGRGAIVVGMGSLGAGTLTAGSDLDLIVIYDPLDQESSNGKKEIPSRLYYARLTQSLITAISAPMAQGKLFEVDMRLRPSGNQGPVATSWSAFQSYQQQQAWVWEHLALTRAAVVSGPARLAEDFDAFQTSLIGKQHDVKVVLAEVAKMRSRINEAKSSGAIWEVKTGAGRLQEIELAAQAGTLLSGEIGAATIDGLNALHRAGVLTAKDAESLQTAASLYRDVNTSVRLLSDKPLEKIDIGPSAKLFLERALGCPSQEALEEKLLASYTRCDDILTRALTPFDPERDAK